MDFLRVGKFRRVKKPDPEKETAEKTAINLEKHKSENNEGNGVADLSYKPTDSVENDEIEDDDDDFITNEVKRRLKELRNNSFMGSIPEEEEEEESYVEEEEEEKEKCQSEWRDVVAEGRQWWGGFDALYEKYCERMLFFDRLSSQQLKETGVGVAPSPSTPSPRSASKKLASPFRCLSLKKLEAPEEETEHLQQQPETDPCNDLETAYVAQLCLTWEALHCQYTQLGHLISCQPETRTSYNHSAQQFQQFLVLLQRFIENEPFEHGSRAELYARTRNAMPKLLQSPKIQGSDEKEMDKETDFMVLADDLMGILESSILTFYVFLKTDKRKPNGNHNNMTTTLLQVKSSLEKKRVKVKELCKRTRGWRKKSWPQTWEGVELLFALIDVKIVTRVLRMARVGKDQLVWCGEKMKKLDFPDGKLQRHPTPILFPC
ncbi:PREDICTED: uncharacterized protein LOC104817846 [Tarenaya hassleriana]|uniref:uncharacterized protein LOC104817846 n=1 Tax=Tarenaya hassleriana TaxID=28532 RepID=UPI00053C4A51|nr:PREDICTED: uncharacterized protein LOC104817846 [Tarenaya hassleriana]